MLCALLVASVFGATSFAVAQSRQVLLPTDPAAETLYVSGRKLFIRGKYMEAARQFHKMWSELPTSQYTIEGRFWEAFAIFQAKRPLPELRKAFALLEEQKRYSRCPL